MTTLDQVRQLLSDHLGHDLVQIDEDSHLTDDLGCDDLDHIEMLIAVEEQFDITIEDDEWDKMAVTVAGLVTLIDRKVGA